MWTEWRIVTGILGSHQSRNGWRLIALTTSVSIVIVVLTIGLSLTAALKEEQHRSNDRAVAQRLGSPEVTDNDDGIWLLESLDSYENQQYLVKWIEPNVPSNSVLPPGMHTVPDPGEAFVSPHLAALIAKDPLLASRYPVYQILSNQGIADGDELYAWVRPSNREVFLEQPNLSFVASFNYQSEFPNQNGSTLEMPVPMQTIWSALVVVCVLPSILLMTAAMSAHSSIREERFTTLAEMGVSRKRLIRLNVLEGLLISVPVCCAVLLIMSRILAGSDHIPLVRRPVVSGDLSLSLAQIAEIFIAVQLMVVLSSVLQIVLGRNSQFSKIRVSGKLVWTLRAIAILFAPIVVIYSYSQGINNAVLVLFSNLLLVIAIVPGFLKDCIFVISRWLSKTNALQLEVGGSHLVWLGRKGIRPYIGLSLAIIVILQGIGMVATYKGDADVVDNTDSPSSARVMAQVPQDHLLATLQDGLPGTLVFPAYDASDRGSNPVFGISCFEIARFVGVEDSRCSETGLTRADVFGSVFYDRNAVFDESLVQTEAIPTSVMVVSRSSMYQTDMEVRSILGLADYPGLFIATPESFRVTTPPVVSWIERAVMTFVVLVGISTLGSVVNQSLSRESLAPKILVIGGSRPTIAKLVAFCIVVPTVTAWLLGLGIGMFELFILDRITPLDWRSLPFSGVLGYSLLALFVATALVVVLNLRLAYGEEQ